METEPVIIVGAGAGGLACALDLAASGCEVLVLERAEGPGGKIRQAGTVEAGPTVFTMKWVFEDLAAQAGRRLEDLVSLAPLEILARHDWGAGEGLDLHADPRRSEAAIGAFAGAAAAAGYRAFHKEAAGIFQTLRSSFLERSRTGPLGLTARVGLARFPEVLALRPFATLAGRLEHHFEDPRLRQLFGRYATYCGSSPYRAPATLMLVAHVEQMGVFAIEGGLSRLAAALAAAVTDQGGRVRYGAEVSEIVVRRGRVAGVVLADGERISTGRVIFNGDPAALAAGLLGPEARRAARARAFKERSLSAVTLAFEGRAAGFSLLRHNVFFSGDYRREFEELLGERRLASDPTIYVCAQDRGFGPEDPSARERLLVLVNAPARGEAGDFPHEELTRCTTGIWERLRRSGLELTPSEPSLNLTTPADFHSRFPGSSGALYGDATHGWAAAFRRPAARSRIQGLYLAGGACHPGPGVPMATLSGRRAAEAVRRDLASTSRFRRGATFGGISTPLAATGAMASPSSLS